MNDSIRKAAKEANVPLWKVALTAGISEATLTRWMRVKLPSEREHTLLEAIKQAQREEV